MKIIMNPPYDGNLHLKILDKMTRDFPEAEIVNLSPIRWLEDPLAEHKKDSDWTKFENTRQKIKDIEVISCNSSNKAFDISFGDLGIYKIDNNESAFDIESLRKKSPLEKVCKNLGKTFMDVASREGYRGEYNGIFGIINSHYGDTSSFISDDYDLFIKPRYTNTNKVLQFSSEEERQNCFEFLTSKFMKAYAKFIRVNQRVPWRFVPYLDFSHPWTDKMLYDHFKLTPEEIATVEKETGE